MADWQTVLLDMRKAKRLSREQAAHLAGVPLGTLRNWECGLSEPPLGRLEKLLDAYGYELWAVRKDGRLC